MKMKIQLSKDKIILLIAILVLLVITLCFVIDFTNKKDDKNAENVSSSIQISSEIESNINISSEVAVESEQNSESSESSKPIPDKWDTIEELESILKAYLPRMDGSTSTIPLEAGIKAALFGISQESAEAGIAHSTTYGSFDNLIEGNCDIIFSTPLSQEQYNKAKEANITLVETPVVYEGFVFVVNASNPVDTLTQQQLKDIYSGKITNWKQVGGNDAPIVAYQRNETSGSQNYMKAFMKDSSLMKPLTTFTPDSMSGLLDVIANYDNSENAIGYSVYAYAANMYGNGNEIKFIRVDGVEPTKETMAAQKYPLLNYNYAIYNRASEADTTVDELTQWLLTDNGQIAMVNAGYVPVRNVKVKELKIEPYTSKGTSNETKADISDYYFRVENTSDIAWVSSNGWWNAGDIDVRVTALKNKTLQDKINEFIEESVKKIKPFEAECKNYVDLLNRNNGYANASPSSYVPYDYMGRKTYISCVNGYLCASVSLEYRYNKQNGFEYTYKRYSKIYDLYSGKELSLSDLFYKNEDFVSIINDTIENRIPYGNDLTILEIETKRPYATLPKDYYSIGISPNGVYLTFDKANPYFVDGVSFTIETYLENISCINKPRDMKGIFTDDVKIQRGVYYTYYDTNLAEKKTSRCNYSINYIDSPNTEMNNIVNGYIDEKIAIDKNIEMLAEKTFGEGSEQVQYFEQGGGYADIGATLYGNKYARISVRMDMEKLDIVYLDVKTGKVVSESEFRAWKDSIET